MTPAAMKNSTRSVFVVVSLAASALAMACERTTIYSSTRPSDAKASATAGGQQGASSGGGVSRQAVLAAAAECVAAATVEHEALAATFAQKAKALAANPAGAAEREAARGAWGEVIDAWQRLEPLQVGPAGPSTLPGGRDLREHIYAWPLFSRCLIDQNTVSEAYLAADFEATSLVNVRGLGAAEYLLFHETPDNGCAASASINAGGAWAAIDATTLAARRAAHASVVAGLVAQRATALSTAWAASGENFAAQLAGAGQGGKVYPTEQLALNALSDALFYVEKQAKDAKLGRPLGLVDCTTPTCPEALESRFAKRSRRHVRNNLIGLRRVLLGCGEGGAGVGFDDLLTGVGAEPVASRLRASFEAALLAIDAIGDESLEQALANDKDSVQAAHAALRDLTDVMKTDFITVLDLDLPKVVEGDND